ncbi:creatininase family protein [Halobacterium wangiae]|uniref:creatininase family protein n=1 Tax=Halobacterium wangiae TaxID=2902623 RepID=UPI001E4C957C|nr:creatininase family protein [Halobacterium wangiae]
MDEDDQETADRDSVRLAELSWTDVEAALEGGVDTVVVPLGATEQHGPHLPLDTDTRLAAELAERVARRLGGALVAPAIPVGPSTEHTGFPGTISVSPETLTALLRDYVDSFEAQGFERVVVLPGHGGSFPVVEAAFPELARETDVDVIAVTGLRRYMELLESGLREAGIDVEEPVVHAGASETAMVLAVAPELVADDLPEGYTGPVSAAALFAEGVETHADNGVLGDASPATAEAGETVLEHVTDAHAAIVREEFAALRDS